ncbi:MAG: hypothetical protein ACRCY4_09460 [Brevinema sp.]
MLKEIVSDIKTFFSQNGLTLQNNAEDYVRLIRIINTSYSQLSSEYPLPELDHVISIFEKNSSEWFCDFIPFQTTDNRVLENVSIADMKLLEPYPIASLYGLEATIPTSTLIINGSMSCELIMRKSFSVETAPTHAYKYKQTIAPHSTYQITIHYLSTWFTNIYINDKKTYKLEEAQFPMKTWTHSVYGTIVIDFINRRVTIHSARQTYEITIEVVAFNTGIYRAVIDKTGIRFLQRSAYQERVTFTQRTRPPMLLTLNDVTINQEYDHPLVLYSIENLMSVNRSMIGTEIFTMVNQKKTEQLDRLARTVYNYRKKRTLTRESIPFY